MGFLHHADIDSGVKVAREYSRSNCITSLASGSGNVSEPRLMLQAGSVRKIRVRVDQSVSAITVEEVPVYFC